MESTSLAVEQSVRQLHPRWNKAMIAASIAISFLGAFTSTQLMCHASLSVQLRSVFVWSMLGSLIFGFCSIWCLHEVAMLATEFDLPIGIDAPLTVLSSVLAVSFTFVAVATDMLWDRWRSKRRGKSRRLGKSRLTNPLGRRRDGRAPSATPLLHAEESEDDIEIQSGNFANGPLLAYPSAPLADSSRNHDAGGGLDRPSSTSSSSMFSRSPNRAAAAATLGANNDSPYNSSLSEEMGSQHTRSSSDHSWFPAGDAPSSSSSYGLSNAIDINPRLFGPAQNPFVATAKTLYSGFTLTNIIKGFLWSLAITSMHYSGTFALRIPSGYCRFNPWLVILSALISWLVCTVGCILMARMETHLPQQILFSIIAAAGVASMHFTGIWATTFYSSEPPSEIRGYPPALANAVVGIAFVTCITANLLLAHSATVARNKLAEIFWTRKELWKTIAQKESAEAAARARSDFIASASHEIRTPLHHLSGHSDLLARTELTDEGRALLTAIQRATKTLSLITNNVLDWSKFERSTEDSYRPVALDIRAVCDSIIVLLPNVDDEAKVELYVVVSPDVPPSLFLDETWIHRILMNLLSNALKFTRQGYILLSVEVKDENLVATVRDTGCGLDPAFIPEMWTPFKQGEVRGSARGTGLGLSIIKQLLQRMNGKIDVESNYELLESVGPERSGTTFAVTLPLHLTTEHSQVPPQCQKPRVAVLTKTRNRSTEGLIMSWEIFGFEALLCSSVAELNKDVQDCAGWKYVWTDVDFLGSNPDQFELLLQRKELLVLVPYNTNDSLDSMPGILSAANFVLVPKPLIWHAFEKRILNAKQRRLAAAPPQALRFATDVEVLNGVTVDGDAAVPSDASVDDHGEHSYKRKHTILLVEDNRVNQKLGKKMLLSLGYAVLLASDGVEAIEILLTHDSEVDAILMDQSMPRRDGVSATREIRRLEAEGKLKGRNGCVANRRPIIALTAVVSADAKREFSEAGADDFLAKPLGLGILKDALDQFLGRGG